MRRGIRLLSLVLLLPGALAARDVPRIEIFGGYSHFRMPGGFDLDSLIFTVDDANLNGWNVTVTGNLNRWLGAEGDFGGYSGTVKTIYAKTGGVDNRSVRIHSYLFGPRFLYRGDHRFTPFIHALFGTVVLVQAPLTGTSKSTFGLALGGGLDIRVVHHLAIRAIQADYLRSRFGTSVENNLRLSFGAVLRF
jgi:opacity protein-like surface antigen